MSQVHRIEHDGFEGTVIGAYVTREGKRGVVLQQVGTKVVHVYGEKWLTSTTQPTPTTTGVTEEMVERAHAEYHKILGDHNRSNPMRAALEAALSTAPAGDGVPGMVLVPIEPDSAMCMAGYDAVDHEIGVVDVARAYRAMLSTASTAGKG